MLEKRSNLLLWIVLGGAAFLFFALCLVALVLYFGGQAGSPFSLTANQIVVLDIEGIVFDSDEFVDQLEEYGGNSSVKAVLLHLNTPGGGVAASQEMHNAVRKFRAETGKKVVASMASVAASGGYYIACAADRIFANPGTITGSIGVIAEWLNYGDLMRWAKMQSVVIKSGDLKDAGSPTRPLTEAEEAYFQSLIDNMYEQFVSEVARSRKMDETAVRKLADGRVFTGEEAKNNGLIDELGSFQDALAEAARLSGIQGDPKILRPPKRGLSLLDFLLGDSGSFPILNPDRSESHIRFQYLWR